MNMSASSFMNRDSLILNQNNSVPRLSNSQSAQNEFIHLTVNSPLAAHHQPRPSPQTMFYDELQTTPLKSNLPSTQSHVTNQQSPKMSPDSTLCHSMCSGFLQHSPKIEGSSSTSSSTCESFLRSALLSDPTIDRSCVGSSTTGISFASMHGLTTTPTKCDLRQLETDISVLAARDHAADISPLSNTEAPAANISPSASIPSSTTRAKKSSRRNPWGSETYSDLITIAIHSYPDKQATLQQIYDFITSHYEYFRERSDAASSAGWKNSIRHNLSLHDRFSKCPKSSDNTKSSYWRINPEVSRKPYIRRRACSIDGVKRAPGKPGRIGGSRGARQNEKMLAMLYRDTSHLPCLTEAQPYPVDAGAFPTETCHKTQAAKTSTNYFNYGLNPSDNHCPWEMWRQQTTQSTNRSQYGGVLQPGSVYACDQLADSSCDDHEPTRFSATDFQNTITSTDQTLVRNRANSLIEHLLRTENASINQLISSEMQLSQPYLPNGFFVNQQHLASIRSLSDSSFIQPSEQNTTESRHRFDLNDAVYMQSSPTEVAPNFNSPTEWHNYTTNVRFPYSQFTELSSYDGGIRRLIDLKSSFFDQPAPSQHHPHQSFDSNHGAPISPSTNSSTSSSTRSWRPSLSLDPLASSDNVHHASTYENIPRAPPLCASVCHPASTGSIDLPRVSFVSSSQMDCALDTPPYLLLKQEPPDEVVTRVCSTTTAHDCTPNRNSFSRSTVDVLSTPSSTANARNFSDTQESDQYKYELELSLELAERIVASTVRPAGPM